jgi:hypothetical protein
MTADEFQERMRLIQERSARYFRMAQALHQMQELLDIEYRAFQAEYNALWTWYLQRLARGEEDTLE